ncbi:MAG TPA: ribosome small subunit-dependent GTPase A [Pirellulales bacterium]|jgi:ribosome biogenesis GTPase|nr:ribosome small subunit-dependent GTPase A [Pirellulales bacterium]
MSKRKIRADFRKNRTPRQRSTDLTRRFEREDYDDQLDEPHEERISGKGELSRKRTVVGSKAEEETAGFTVHPEIDLATCRPGRVLSVHGLLSMVEAEDGTYFRCTTRRLLRTLSTDQRHVIAAGDRVLFCPADLSKSGAAAPEGTMPDGNIERIEPRRTLLSRTVRGKQHVIATNVDQMLIVTSAAEPRMKPGLIDRFLICAEKGKFRPVVCINKIDLVELASLQPLIGVYSRMGYQVLMVSATQSLGIEQLREELDGKFSVVVGQSGVGKTSLLNAIEPGLDLRVAAVSAETQKGKHTTTAAQLLRLAGSTGYVVDTPGIRQFQLWDVIPAEVAGYFRDLRPFINHCKFPNCTHRHEADCAVKNAVADGWLDVRRYESYCLLFEGDEST